MARIKPKNSITNKEQAHAAIAKVNNIDMQLAGWDMEEANEIAALREKHAEKQRKGNRVGIEAEKSLLVKELSAWAETDSQTWEKKTYETPFGKMGFRVSTPAVVLVKKVARNFKEALALLAARLPEFVRNEPVIYKEAILAIDRVGGLDISKLEKCGLAIEQREEFWLETNASKDLEEAGKRLRAA